MIIQRECWLWKERVHRNETLLGNLFIPPPTHRTDLYIHTANKIVGPREKLGIEGSCSIGDTSGCRRGNQSFLVELGS